MFLLMFAELEILSPHCLPQAAMCSVPDRSDYPVVGLRYNSLGRSAPQVLGARGIGLRTTCSHVLGARWVSSSWGWETWAVKLGLGGLGAKVAEQSPRATQWCDFEGNT